MKDDYETYLKYKKYVFDRRGHTFRLTARSMTDGRFWISQLRITTPIEAHLYAVKLMRDVDRERQVWIEDETAGDIFLPLMDIWKRYEEYKANRCVGTVRGIK